MRRRGLRQTAPVFFALRLARVLATVKDLDSLARLCLEKLAEDSFPGCVLVFRSRSGTAIRRLSYDGQGYWLTQKWLSKGEILFNARAVLWL
jgi:IS66 Orf2 like protein